MINCNLLFVQEIKKSEERNIVLDCDYDKIEMILSQADGQDMLTDYHNWLSTSLDIDKINLDAYVLHNVNITGFRVVDPDSHAVQQYLKKYPNAGSGKENFLYSDNALIHDAVRVYAKALDDLDALEVTLEKYMGRGVMSGGLPLKLSYDVCSTVTGEGGKFHSELGE